MFKPGEAYLFGSMVRTFDSNRAFGSYVSSPVAGIGNYAEWLFNINSAGEYALGGSTYSTLGTNDSFYVQIDNGPLILWEITGNWGGYWFYQPVTSGATSGMLRFDLAAGSHSLKVYAQSTSAELEYMWLNQPNPAKTPSLAPVSYSNFEYTPDAKSTTGYSLSSPAGSNPTNCTALYQIPVPQSGNYLLLGRTRAQNGSANSFYLSINGGAPQSWVVPISGTNWTWAAIGSNTNMSLTAGTLLDLHVSGNEGGTELDSFVILQVP